MVKITLDIADNGTIKTISDDNSNGAGGQLEQKTVYDFDNDKNHKRKIEFLYELTNDLGIETGNKHDKNNLLMKIGWGGSYLPTEKEVLNKIKSLEFEIDALKMLIEPEDEPLNEEDEKS
jgi:hypothetical protein